MTGNKAQNRAEKFTFLSHFSWNLQLKIAHRVITMAYGYSENRLNSLNTINRCCSFHAPGERSKWTEIEFESFSKTYDTKAPVRSDQWPIGVFRRLDSIYVLKINTIKQCCLVHGLIKLWKWMDIVWISAIPRRNSKLIIESNRVVYFQRLPNIQNNAQE